MVNSNPETVSTDYDTSDRLYLEPVTLERVLDVCALEQPLGVVVTLGGQTPLRLAQALADAGVALLGDPLPAIEAAEDRGSFGELSARLGLRAPAWGVANATAEAREIAAEIGYPVLLRPHYVLGGRGCASRADRTSSSWTDLSRRRVSRRRRRARRGHAGGRRRGLGGRDPRARRAGGSPFGRLGLCDPGSISVPRPRARGRSDRLRPGARPPRPRAPQSPAGAARVRALRPRGQPARLADCAIRRQGDRPPACRPRLPAHARRAAGRTRPARACRPDTCVGEGSRFPVRPLRRRGRTRPRDALDRGGHGGGSTPSEAYARALRAAGRSRRAGPVGPPLQHVG